MCWSLIDRLGPRLISAGNKEEVIIHDLCDIFCSVDNGRLLIFVIGVFVAFIELEIGRKLRE